MRVEMSKLYYDYQVYLDGKQDIVICCSTAPQFLVVGDGLPITGLKTNFVIERIATEAPEDYIGHDSYRVDAFLHCKKEPQS